ncbi:hypothetical protein B0H17DRAFT_1222587 [Mycena rosella]|uniref:Uncharacterized protein n=1 Tax=Mycena rosella TaxID=1033263 RepID=A0AAD7AXK9_MYCRO|nr:hypothetical protein B0H17DRAFT_1222587 [Mycena rosella]
MAAVLGMRLSRFFYHIPEQSQCDSSHRLCQLQLLANYIKGLGLEDLEGCERFFSKSNGLARSVRYASRFHRKFLCNNYDQALDILKTEDTIKTWMAREGIQLADVFHHWLEEERVWLLMKKNLSAEQVVTLEMEYVQKLVNLSTSKFYAQRPQQTVPTILLKLWQQSKQKAHVEEVYERDMTTVQNLEDQLKINKRWTTDSPGYQSAVKALKERKYIDTPNALELLIVERLLELTKINMLQTGYKMHGHIAKVLQAHSGAVKNAIHRYNVAALSLEPPAPQLSWEEVVEYAFLADFDLL